MSRTASCRSLPFPRALLAAGLTVGLALSGCSKDNATRTENGTDATPNSAYDFGSLTPPNPAHASFCEHYIEAAALGETGVRDRFPQYKESFKNVAAEAPAEVTTDLAKYNSYVQSLASSEGLAMDKQPADVTTAVTNVTVWVATNCMGYSAGTTVPAS